METLFCFFMADFGFADFGFEIKSEMVLRKRDSEQTLFSSVLSTDYHETAVGKGTSRLILIEPL